LSAIGTAKVSELTPWTGELLGSCFVGEAPWQGTVDLNGADIAITAESTLEGIEVVVPPPLAKVANEVRPIELKLNLGGRDQPRRLAISYSDTLNAILQSNPTKSDKSAPSFFDQSIISMGPSDSLNLAEGINFDIKVDDIDLDAWTDALVNLSKFKTA